MQQLGDKKLSSITVCFNMTGATLSQKLDEKKNVEINLEKYYYAMFQIQNRDKDILSFVNKLIFMYIT